ncbi:MAG: EF-hand domain-containing protein [Betaproteobacteria bacterium]
MAIVAACPVALAADPAPAVIETPLRDPWVPPQSRSAPAASQTRGAELRAQVDRKLAAAFDAADVAHAGTLTREQARAAGLGFVVRHFDDIDTQRTGIVRFDDLRRFLDANRERARARKQPAH